jgi:hypothetical protein
MAADGEEQQVAADRGPPGHDLLAAVTGCVALALFVFSPWLVDRSGPDPFYKGPLIFPMMVLAMIVASAIPSAWRLAVRRPPRPFHVDGGGFPVRGAAQFILMCFYPPAIAAVGLEMATFAVVFLGLLLNRRGMLQSLLVAASLASLSWLAFRAFLDIWFPQPWLLSMTGA